MTSHFQYKFSTSMHSAQGPSSAVRDLLCLRTQFLAHTKRRVPKSGSSGTQQLSLTQSVQGKLMCLRTHFLAHTKRMSAITRPRRYATVFAGALALPRNAVMSYTKTIGTRVSSCARVFLSGKDGQPLGLSLLLTRSCALARTSHS